METKINKDYVFDAIVIGAGHAGIEAGLALARMGQKTAVFAISLDSVGYLACNPSIGGTAKGHLVREIDALGGEMGKTADKAVINLRMLNSSKGFAVQSLRAQVDKYRYHTIMKSCLENQPSLHLRQAEATEIEPTVGGYIVRTTLLEYFARSVVVAAGVYLKSRVFVGEHMFEKGPSSFAASSLLSSSLQRMGIELRRFKTGTPARVKRSSINLDMLEVQKGEHTPYSFSCSTKKVNYQNQDCFLGYTNTKVHQIISENLHKTPRSLGLLSGTGARYCPSIEDKIQRFDRTRHQFFLEPEGVETQEMYVQGLSSSLPADVQLSLYRAIEGFENVEIMRDAYAIEYDCIDARMLKATLEHKEQKGLFFAGQLCGTSGYEEAAAQGLIAGINAALFLQGREQIVLSRSNSYIGVMIDDLVTKGTDEPYRMMTSRAEFRLSLRQDNADIRLTEIGREVGLVGDKQYRALKKKQREIARIESLLGEKLSFQDTNGYIDSGKIVLSEYLKRHDVDFAAASKLDILRPFSAAALLDVFVRLRYGGYLLREENLRKEHLRLEEMPLPADIDYKKIGGLRTEAAEKLTKIQPHSIGQAMRISGVNPADIDVLIISFARKQQ